MNNQSYMINADDFGLNENVNKAIVSLFDSGHITSASIMSGMPGFLHAVALAKEHKMTNAIGIHLNITEGKPLTDAIRLLPALVDRNNQFNFSVSRSILHMPATYIAAIRTEFSQQIEMCIEAGILPQHIDSHHHVHNVWPIGTIVIDLAKKYNIPSVRIARNSRSGMNITKRIFKTAYNLRLKYHGVDRADFMGSIYDYMQQKPPSHSRVEIMVHPVIVKGVVVDSVEKRILGTLIEEAFR